MTLLREPAVPASVAVVSVWYGLGVRGRRLRIVGRRRSRRLPWRGCAFALSLATVVVALDSPLERQADTLFWMHMLQHVLLMMVAAPLVVVGAPWMPMWRAFPLRCRRVVARAVVMGPRAAWLRRLAMWLGTPLVAWILFNADLALWHVPSLYDLTLRSTALHYLEHATFLVFGVLFWAQVIDSPPFHPRLNDFRRAIYATAGAFASWLLAIVLALAPRPLYPLYSGHHGLSAYSDQQLAAGVMLGPGSIPYAIVVIYCLYVWLGGDEPRRHRRVTHAAIRAGGR